MLRDQPGRENAETLGSDGGTVVDNVDPLGEPFHRIDVAAIGLLELGALGEILKIPADHVVVADNLMASANEIVGEVTAQETGNTGNTNLHRFLLRG